MEHIPHSEAQKFEKGSVTSYEYRTTSEKLNVALTIVDGRYPDSGYTSNSEVFSIVHVVGGAGWVHFKNGRSFEISQDDHVEIEVNEPYYFEGNLEMIYIATPPWTPEQTRAVE